MISTNRNEGNRITERREIDKYTQADQNMRQKEIKIQINRQAKTIQ